MTERKLLCFSGETSASLSNFLKAMASSKLSELTEENLEVHNSVHDVIHLEEKIFKTSPYYRGLTDSSLVLNRSLSPGRESYATSVATNTSISTIIVARMKDLNSCFGCSKGIKNNNTKRPKSNNVKHDIPSIPSRPLPPKDLSLSTETSSVTPSMRKEKEVKKDVGDGITKGLDKKAEEKLLTEISVTPPRVTALTSPSEGLENNNIKHPNSNDIKQGDRAIPSRSLPLKELSALTETSIVTPLMRKEKEVKKDMVGGSYKRAEKILTGRSFKPSRVTEQTLPSEEFITLEKEEIEEVANQTVFTWADKYQPKVLDDFICNRDKAIQLKDLMREGGCGHFIFEGPTGVGKRTMIWAMLREAFGDKELEIREERKVFNLKSEMVGSIQVNVKESRHHVEVNLSETKGYEKQVIVELIKETHNKRSKKDFPCGPESCRGIILCVADKLSTDALLYIKWVVERYKGSNKIFFCCSDVSKLQPIKSLCTVVHLLPPSEEEIVEVLEYIAKQESIELPRQLAQKITEDSKNNLRQAIRSFEATFNKDYPFKEDQEILTGWEDDIENIAKKIVKEQSPRQLYNIRRKLQNLIEHDVSYEYIFKTLVEELKKLLDKELQQRIESLYADYNKNDDITFASERAMVSGFDRSEEMCKINSDPLRKHVQHFFMIEEFIAKFMSCYKGETNRKNMPHQTGSEKASL